MTALCVLFERFVKEKRYLQNVTPKTLDWYGSAWVAFNKSVTVSEPDQLTKTVLSEFVVASRDRGLSPVTVNTWSKALNAFFGWLYAEGHLSTKLAIASLKTRNVCWRSSRPTN
jgi:site-specific recombinase XerC